MVTCFAALWGPSLADGDLPRVVRIMEHLICCPTILTDGAKTGKSIGEKCPWALAPNKVGQFIPWINLTGANLPEVL